MLTRSDLPLAQQWVQSIHAAIEASRLGLIEPNTPHPHLVLCCVKDEDSLRTQAERLEFRGVSFHKFHEPDRDNELTAIATAPITGKDRRLFSNLQLAKGA